MVKLNTELVVRTSNQAKKKKNDDESLQSYLKKLTHLYLAEKNIDEIEDFSQCRSLSVLYLYDNNVSKIQNLDFASNLTHLYLQNNEIRKIENLENLRKLSKLYLGANRITVVEGMARLDQLKELHIENQKLPPGEKLLFEPRSLATLTGCLQVLNVSGNHLESLEELKCLGQLTQLIASDNKIADTMLVGLAIGSWRQLSRLELVGNPMCKRSKYRDRIIVMSDSLAVLDGKEISQMEKNFLKKWKEAKDLKRKQKLEEQSNHSDNSTLGELPPLHIPHRVRVAAAAAAVAQRHHLSGTSTRPTAYMMPGVLGNKKEFEAVLSRSANPHAARMARQRPPPLQKSHTDLDRPRRIPQNMVFRAPDSSPIADEGLPINEMVLYS